jgi:tripartite-type tricarboxylate transporter receptor subunit TctC
MASAAYAGAGRLSAQAAKSATTTASRTASSGASTCISPSGLSGGVLTGTAPSFCTFGLGSEARRSADRKPPGPIGGGRSVLPFSPQRRLSHCPAAAGNANIAEKPGRKHMTIRRLLLFGALIFAGSWPLAGAKAEDNYPSKPVRIIVSFSAGGPTDIVARVVGAKMGDLLGQQFVVENRVGAGGNIGADQVAKSPSDGYTLLMATVSTHAINPGLYRNMPYDPVRDFAPVAQIGVTPTLLGVHPSLPATDVKSLVALTKQNPGKYTYGSSGLGSILHLCGEQFKALAGGINIVHVPYRGSAPMMSDLVGGQISMAFDATPTAMPQAKAGAIRAIGAGMATRMRAMPELPTLQEQGLKGFECYTWNAILAPAGTPQAIVDRLSESISTALADPAIIHRLEETGVDPTPGSTPQKATAFVKAELAKWGPIIKASGAHID